VEGGGNAEGVCILGFNRNRGALIALRLRTDDFR